MKNKDNDTEMNILWAAEEIFLEKGFTGAKTTEIAKLAGVNHAMLHYYFRTKEKLFEKVFTSKAEMLANSFTSVFDSKLSFFDKVKLAIATHFDFLIENPRLPLFLINEMLHNPLQRERAKAIITPNVLQLFSYVQENIDEEVKKGTIYPIQASDLILNIVSLNIFNIVLLRLASEDGKMIFGKTDREFLEERKQNTIRMVLNDLKK
ncbi:MAG: TetR/AcrR family transcriptional regulator [Bacteroides sp.]|nr:TetR/AcrR family transcriptional regulator [Bacteroides sp.]